MSKDTAALAALIGSRICHDLISPIGAIHNGLELISLSGGGSTGPEMELIQQSCENATAKIQFFRIAFGSTGSEQIVPSTQAKRTLDDLAQSTRMMPDWRADANLPRSEVQLAYLAYQCLETALPMGGSVVIDHDGDRWHITALAARISPQPELWALLETPSEEGANIKPAHVQFQLLAVVAASLGRPVDVRQDEGVIEIRI